MTLKWCLVVALLTRLGPPPTCVFVLQEKDILRVQVFHQVTRVVGNGLVLKALHCVGNFSATLVPGQVQKRSFEGFRIAARFRRRLRRDSHGRVTLLVLIVSASCPWQL